MTVPILREHRDAWVEIDPTAASSNVMALAGLVGPRCRLAPVVKANAYGHGAVEITRALMDAGIRTVCVGTLDEALELRSAGLDPRIIVLFEVPAGAIGDAIPAGIELTVATPEMLEAMLALPAGVRAKIALQVKLDSGMSRQGLRFDRLEEFRDPLVKLSGSIRGLWTHLADGADPARAGDQLHRFDEMVALLRTWGIEGERHASSSSALLAGFGREYEMARPGLAVYGVLPDEFTSRGVPSPVELRPVMAVRARPSRLIWLPEGAAVGYGGTHVTTDRTLVALFPLGYADGLRRGWGNSRAFAVHAGLRSPIIGRVSMDSCAADVTAVDREAGVSADSVFTFLGRDGGAAQTAEELARTIDTVPHDVLVGFDHRLPRVYVEG